MKSLAFLLFDKREQKKKNKWQIPVPQQLKNIKHRDEKSSVFAFRQEGTMVSYVPKKGKNVILISSLHFDAAIDEESGNHNKPGSISFYNQTKGGVDTVDKLCATYNVARGTRRWPMVIFFAMLNVAGINAQIVFAGGTRRWPMVIFFAMLNVAGINAQIVFAGNGGVITNRRMFLRQPAKDLVHEQMIQRVSNKKLPTSLHSRLLQVTTPSTSKTHENDENIRKRKLCAPCQKDKQRKNTKYCCRKCGQYLCLGHVVITCNSCYDQFS
ncbi:Transposase IS4 [Popillia japonica]|uniref:Transposase IS4 n=1 Tax=Popillia japonica TaxID=7064 RepID=A0AAW1L3A6_POPJA